MCRWSWYTKNSLKFVSYLIQWQLCIPLDNSRGNNINWVCVITENRYNFLEYILLWNCIFKGLLSSGGGIVRLVINQVHVNERKRGERWHMAFCHKSCLPSTYTSVVIVALTIWIFVAYNKYQESQYRQYSLGLVAERFIYP